MKKIAYLYIILAFIFGLVLTSLFFSNYQNKTSVTNPTAQVASTHEKTFSLVSFKGDSQVGGVYSFAGRKSMDLFYKHDPNNYFSNLICFTPIKPSEFTYSGKDDVNAISQDYCVEISSDLLTTLHKSSVPTVKGETGDMTQDYFDGSVNAVVTGYTIDTRGMETYNKITIEKINEVYR